MTKEKKTFAELREARLAANEKLGDIYMKAANRELNNEEQMEVYNLTREIEQCENAMRGINLETENIKANAARERADKAKYFRELLKDSRDGKSSRTILLNATDSNVSGNVEASGAITLNIHDILPTLQEGLELPKGINIVTGVTGNEVWPVSINDVEVEEAGEVDAATEQTLEFANITPTVKRITLAVNISNMAIDNAAFDLLAFVQAKFRTALRVYLAKKVYSQAEWNGLAGPFSGLTATEITLGENAYKNILAAVAEFADKGLFDGDVCITMSRATEAELKATPKVAGAAAGFVIEDGKCCGYPYTVSHFINTTLNDAGTAIENTEDKYIGIGWWGYEALQQHGEVRLTIDGNSASVAKNNVTSVIMNSAWSLTDLSVYLNGGDSDNSYPTQAFGLYKIVEDSSSDL